MAEKPYDAIVICGVIPRPRRSFGDAVAAQKEIPFYMEVDLRTDLARAEDKVSVQEVVGK